MPHISVPTETEYAASGAWGMLTSIDIHGCNPATVRSAEAIKKFTAQVCERIDMKRYGDTQVVEFGDDPRVHGYSMVQLIETSLVSAHFAEETNSVYLDVFSCKYYDAARAAAFAAQFFEGKEYNAVTLLRGKFVTKPLSELQQRRRKIPSMAQ
ncbi:MAG: S-adenosylmethionine decarboxylase [Candidatus Peribacteraceae bacterium]|nr:S-adenosylmethionine decarboxylase [Candidatus Peribacteraceae bacterium]